MNKILYTLRRRPVVEELVSCGAEMEAHIDHLRLGTYTQEDHILLLQEFLTVYQENHLRIKLEICPAMLEEIEYRGMEVGQGWWEQAAWKMQPLQDMQILDVYRKGLHDVQVSLALASFFQAIFSILLTHQPP